MVSLSMTFSDPWSGFQALRGFDSYTAGLSCLFRGFKPKHIHCVPKKESMKLWAVTLSNL